MSPDDETTWLVVRMCEILRIRSYRASLVTAAYVSLANDVGVQREPEWSAILLSAKGLTLTV